MASGSVLYTIQYNTIQYNTIQYNAMQCNAMQCNYCIKYTYTALQANKQTNIYTVYENTSLRGT